MVKGLLASGIYSGLFIDRILCLLGILQGTKCGGPGEVAAARVQRLERKLLRANLPREQASPEEVALCCTPPSPL